MPREIPSTAAAIAAVAFALKGYVVFPRHSHSSIQPSDRPCDELLRCNVCSNTSVRYVYIFWVMYQVRDFSQTPSDRSCDVFPTIYIYKYFRVTYPTIADVPGTWFFSQTHPSPVTGRVMNWCSVPCFQILVWDIYFEMICAIYLKILVCGCTLELFYPRIVKIGMGFFY